MNKHQWRNSKWKSDSQLLNTIGNPTIRQSAMHIHNTCNHWGWGFVSCKFTSKHARIWLSNTSAYGREATIDINKSDDMIEVRITQRSKSDAVWGWPDDPKNINKILDFVVCTLSPLAKVLHDMNICDLSPDDEDDF